MKVSMKISVFALILFVALPLGLHAQYSSIKVKEKHKQYTDSLKAVDYNYWFPAWGQGAYKKGFDIPYPAGVMANYMWMKQGLVFDNFQLGLSTENLDIPLTEVDFLQFGENTNISQVVNVRPDLWVLPFLNVYGLFGIGNSHTEVNVTSPVELKSVVDQSVSTKGFGVMGAGGIGPVWFSVDGNWTWSKPELLDEAVRVNVLGIRMGHTFLFNFKPDRNIALWAGGMRAKMNTSTSGEITFMDALPPEFWDRKDQFVSDYWSWYDALDPESIADRKKIEIADEVITPMVENIDEKNGDGTVKYAMDKQVKRMWNGILGAQFQLNKRWMFRSEGGIVGDRKSFLISVNYRFLL